MAATEPAPSLDDTQPRPPIRPEVIDEEPRGCGSRGLTLLVTLILLGMAVTTIFFAGVAGWRDGGIVRQTQRAVALAATIDHQATLGWANLTEGLYELADVRCHYVMTLEPGYPQMWACIATAQAVLSATPTPTPTPTVTPAPATVTPTPTPEATAPPGGTFSPDDLYARGLSAFQVTEYADAMRWLEAVRALDANYRRAEVEALLVDVYLALASEHRFQGQYSSMVFVVRKAQRLDPLTGTDWPFTADVAEMYLSARGYLEAGDVALAAQVFRDVMRIAPAFSSDTRELACRAFAAAGDSAAISQYSCQ